MAGIIGEAIYEGAKMAKHLGDCSIYACREGSDELEQGICTCGFGHQNHWHGGEPEMYSQELLETIEARRVKEKNND
jgi:hypothetical protein